MEWYSWLLKQPRRFYAIGLPLVWGATSLVNFRYPGDEYGGWAVSSLPGLWGAYFSFGNSPLAALPVVLIAGLLVTGAFGVLMDWLAVPWGPWYLLWIVLAGLIFYWSVHDFPTWSRAISKNGSIQAYILPSSNVGLMLSSITCTFLTAAGRSVTRLIWFMRRW